MNTVELLDIGIKPYAEVLALQESIFNNLVHRKLNELSNSDLHKLIICEHFPVITLGKSAKSENILLPINILMEKQIEIFETSRGGDVTLHAPGQIVGYPIFDLEYFSSDLKWYMRQLEEVIIQCIVDYGIEGYRIDGATGVWVNSIIDNEPKKIAAFGVKTSRWITMHGFSLNVCNDLSLYNYINPCGFVDKGVTSIEIETRDRANINEIKKNILEKFKHVFSINLN